jgi:hypothetical protein
MDYYDKVTLALITTICAVLTFFVGLAWASGF